MYKCSFCGGDAEGEVCPSCGHSIFEQPEEQPVEKQQSGSYSDFTSETTSGQTAEAAAKKKTASPTFKGILFYNLNFIPSALFLLFTAVLTIFMFTPAAVLKTKSYNVFALSGAGAAASGCCVFLIICWILCLVYSGALIYLFNARRFDRVLFGETEISVLTIFGALSAILPFVIFITACVAAGITSDGIYSLGSAPVLMLIFSLLFLILIAASVIVKPFMANKQPELLAEESAKFSEAREQKRLKQLEKLGKNEENKRLIAEYMAANPYPAAVAKPDKKIYLSKLNQSQNEFFDKAKHGQNLKKQVCFSALMLFINVCLWAVVCAIMYFQVGEGELDYMIFAIVCGAAAAASIVITIVVNKLFSLARPKKIKKCCSLKPLGFFRAATVICILLSAAFAAGCVYLFISYAPELAEELKNSYQIVLIIAAVLFVIAVICGIVLLVKAASAKRKIKKVRVIAYGTAKINGASPVKSYEELFPEYAKYNQAVEAYNKYVLECKNRDKRLKQYIKTLKHS